MKVVNITWQDGTRLTSLFVLVVYMMLHMRISFFYPQFSKDEAEDRRLFNHPSCRWTVSLHDWLHMPWPRDTAISSTVAFPWNSLCSCFPKWIFLLFLPHIFRSPQPGTQSSLSLLQVALPISTGWVRGGVLRVLFHIMLHKPALNLEGWAIRRWTHCGPVGTLQHGCTADSPTRAIHAKR